MAAENAQIFLGSIIHSKSKKHMEVLDNGFVIIVGSKIIAVGAEVDLGDTRASFHLPLNTPTITLKKSQILIPGFIDTHLHAPQYPNCGLGYSKPLLEWLEEYTFPLEAQYSDLEYSKKVYDAVVKKSLDCGTTTACYFGTVNTESCNVLVDSVVEVGQRALIGKVNMTRNGPENLLETPEKSLANTLEFIRYVQSKKTHLVRPIISPRFAMSLDMEQMVELSLIAKCQDLHIQTHISEHPDEVDWVQTTYGMPYANVYDEAKLLTPKTILAHGLYLSVEELKLLARRGAAVAHCPDSNLCLKSGALNVKQLWDFGITVGLGSDISGGAHPSILKTMKLCIYSSIHFSYRLKDYIPLTFEEVFYLGTLGGAEALALDKQIGSFEVNKDFDALVVDLDVEGGLHLLRDCKPEELLQKFIYSGDDRNIIHVYVAGNLVK